MTSNSERLCLCAVLGYVSRTTTIVFALTCQRDEHKPLLGRYQTVQTRSSPTTALTVGRRRLELFQRAANVPFQKIRSFCNGIKGWNALYKYHDDTSGQPTIHVEFLRLGSVFVELPTGDETKRGPNRGRGSRRGCSVHSCLYFRRCFQTETRMA